MEPNLLALAETMAQHYHNTLRKIKLTKGKRCARWEQIGKKERQDMIEAFAVVLGRAGDQELDEAMQTKNYLPEHF